jgi:hypothetical protein
MRLEPFSGVLTDYLIFGIRPKSEDIPAVRETRAKFTRELEAHPPQVIVVTSRLFLGDLEDYRKLDLWPSFAAFLANHYSLRTDWRPTRTERWWSREEYPAGYRIYVLRAAPSLVSSGNP